MKKNLFVLISAIALLGMVSCESIYDIGKEETDKCLGYQVISEKLVNVWFFDYETGKDVVIDSLEKSDWALYLSGLQRSFYPISLEKKRYTYEEGLSIPIICEEDSGRAIDVEIGGLKYTYTHGGRSYIMEPVHALYIDVGELELWVSETDEVSGEKRYSALFTLLSQDLFTGKDIILAQKRAYFVAPSEKNK